MEMPVESAVAQPPTAQLSPLNAVASEADAQRMRKLRAAYAKGTNMMLEGRLDASFVTATYKDEATRLVSKFSSTISTLDEILRKV